MTTDQAVEYIETWVNNNNKPLEALAPTDKQVKEHLDKCKEALIIIKQDLKGGYRHYKGGCE